MARLTPNDLQKMKQEGKKIAAAVVYDYQIAKICDSLLGVDVLSVGDSLGRNVLGHDDVLDTDVPDMIPFAKAVVKAAERAIVSVDMPMTPSHSGAAAVKVAAKRFKDECGVDMCKVDIRTKEEELFDEVQAVIDVGLGVYPQIGFPTQGASRGIQGGPEVEEYIMKWAHKIQDAGATMIDLTNVPPDTYERVCKSLRIPVIGGQAPQMADGKIQVCFGVVGMSFENARREDNNPSRGFYDRMKKIVDSIHAGEWGTGQFAGV